MIENDFFIDQIRSYYQSKYEVEVTKVEIYRRYLWRKQIKKEYEEKQKIKKILDDELKIHEREDESDSDDEIEEEMKRLEKMTDEQLHYEYILEKYDLEQIPYKREKDVQKNISQNPQLIIKYLSRIVENQEKVNYLKNSHRMFKILSYEIGQIHKVNRGYILKFEVFINRFVTPSHVYRMSKKLKIENNYSLYWVSYLYCMFILRYTREFTQNNDQPEEYNYQQTIELNNSDKYQKNSEDLLNYFIDYENDYDLYFEVLTEFQSIKTDLLLDFIPQKQQTEYLESINWFQFLDDSLPLLQKEEPLSFEQIFKSPMKVKPKEQVYYLEEIKYNPKLYFFNVYTKCRRYDMTSNIIEIRNKYLNSEKFLLSDIIFQISELIHAKH